MHTTPAPDEPATRAHVTRAIEVTLDPSPSQERWLRSCAGSMRSAYNWVLDEVSTNLATRKVEREAGVAENAAAALKNFSEARAGARRGRPVGFPRFKDRHSRQSIRFVEMAEGVDHHHWINQDTLRHVRLMLPRRAPDGTWERRHTRPKSQQARGRDRRSEVAWIRAHQAHAVREVWQLCESGAARVQALTLKFDGGRWKAVFALRVLVTVDNPAGRLRNPGKLTPAWHGGTAGVDLGLQHLATLDRPIDGLTDEQGHVPNPRPLRRHLKRLQRIDRAISRCQKGSENRAKLVRRRQKLHGKITATRTLYLHELTRKLAAGFDVVCVEDLQLSGMARRNAMRLGKSASDAALGELLRQIEYKTKTAGATLMGVGRFHPSSKTCSRCGAARAKLPLHVRVFTCDDCGASIDRDVNAARNIRAEGLRLLRDQLPEGSPSSPRYAGRHKTAIRGPVRPNLRLALVGTGRSRTQPIQPRPDTPRARAAANSRRHERQTRPRKPHGDQVGLEWSARDWMSCPTTTANCRT